MNPNAYTPIALTIAGSDSGGGAGIQADLKTFAALGVYGCSAITSLTAQNTQGVQGVLPIAPEFVTAQIESVVSDLQVSALKTGMLANAAIIAAVAGALSSNDAPLVLDPVMVATSGDRLLEPDAISTLIDKLIPQAAILTPNLLESAALLSAPVAKSVAEMEQQARLLLTMGAKAVLVKGGHALGDEATDLLLTSAGVELFGAKRIETKNTHGTGCTLASAIAAGLAKRLSLRDAVAEAKQYLHGALSHADKFSVGQGSGPVHHFYRIY